MQKYTVQGQLHFLGAIIPTFTFSLHVIGYSLQVWYHHIRQALRESEKDISELGLENLPTASILFQWQN